MSPYAWFALFVLAVCAAGVVFAAYDLLAGWITDGTDAIDWRGANR